LRRGFKAFAERHAEELRRALSITPYEKLSPWDLADHLGILVFYPEDLDLKPDDIEQLTKRDADSWSGLTVKEAALICIILNSSHPKSRQSNTLMHELSHIILKHVPNRVDISDGGMLLLSDFSKEQEDEANCLSGCLLLPRQLLLRLRGNGKSVSEIAQEHGVSNQLCQWRVRMTGVDYQLGHSARGQRRTNGP
jgi:Zn-dependent peptidase ImmA (M78 family)